MRFGKLHLCLLAAVGIILFYATKGQAFAPTTPSTTTLTPSPSTLFTSGASSTTVLTAALSTNATGTVLFKDGSTNLVCSGGNPATVSASHATCTTTTPFSAEGIHVLSATYSGDGIFVGSAGTANVFVMNRSTNLGSTYCNTGAIASTGLSASDYAATTPNPSVIFVGDGVNTDLAHTVSGVSLQLKNFSASAGPGMRMLLVSPDGKAFDFWDGVGSAPFASAGNYIIEDGGVSLPSTPYGPGTYGPTAHSLSAFTPAPPSPAPQVPGGIAYAAPAGSSSFTTAFNGATAHGAWSLFLYDADGAGHAASAVGGWCVTLNTNTGQNTTTTLTSSATPFGTFGVATNFTATVGSSPSAPNQGIVTFTEGGVQLAGTLNGGAANVVSGVATISTSGLSEGDHTVTATYHDPTNTFSDSVGILTIRVDKATSAPTLSGSTWSYCNSGAITIPASGQTGPASPNPSNIVVSNLPGAISSVTVTLKGLHHAHLQNLESLLVGPAGTSLDFFSLGGGPSAFGPQDTTFGDAFAATPLNSPPSSTTGPASYGTTSYTASPFFTLPGVQHAAPQGTSTFNTGAGSVYKNTDANGLWSLYFGESGTTTGNGVNGGWCVNVISTPVTGTGITSHVGPAPSNHMRQTGTGTVSFSLLNNGDSNHHGATGDPDQVTGHALTVTGTLPAGLTLGTVPTGSPWSCTANTTTQVTCTNLISIAQGNSYTPLTIPVNVAGNATATATVSGFTFSGAGMTAGTFASDTISIDPTPVLSILKSHSGTFTQGGTASWNLVVSNTASAAGATDGTTVTVSDTMPSGWTIQSVVSGAGWNCNTTTQTTLLCTSTSVVAGGASFQTITVNVSVPANAAVSTSNTGKVFGGGDPNHTNIGNAASSTDTVTVVQVPAHVNLTAGNNQTVAVSTAFPAAFSVTVTDANNVAMNGVTVTFTAPSSGASGKFTSSNSNVQSVNTNTSGVAQASVYTANTIAGAYTVAVTAGSVSNNFTATNIAGTATQMAANSGTTPQSTTVGTSFTNALAVTIKDASNNPVSGKTVTFTAPASGASGKFSNNTNTIQIITDATGVASAALTANTTAGGPYTVTAAAAGLTTVNFSLTNNGTGPVVTTNPTSITVNNGSNATFTAAASGTPTPTVQWQVSTDGGTSYTNLAGATTTTLSFTAVTANNGNKFRAVFNNASGSATTTAATLTINFAPSVTTNPTSQSVSAGSAATFVAAASGNPTPTVQWQISTNGGGTFANIAGATSTTLSFTSQASDNGNQYRAAFTNTVGSATTTAATLTVTAGPVVTTNPTNQTVNAGQAATFTAAANGTPTPTVQWQFSTDGGATFQNVAGATTTTLTVPNVAAGQNGTKFRAVFTNASGSATTTAATMTVNFAPSVTTNPTSQSVSAGSTATFVAAASGNPTPTVQWQISTNGGATFVNVTGATSTTLSFSATASQNGNQFRAVFTNTVGSATTTAATLTVTAGPVITQNPVNSTINAGQTATFTAAASGVPMPTVQWQFSTDGGATFNNVAGATTTTLTVPNVAAGQNGTKFRAVFTNASGSATTTAATMTVNFAPSVTTNPTSQSGSAGSTATFVAAASGNPTPTVQWQISTNGGGTFANIAGATSTTLSFTSQASDNGNQYRAVFTNTVGTATTTAATLTVTAGPVITQNPVSMSVNAGQTATFTAGASGTPTPTVQWQFSTDGGSTFNNVAGATTTTLTIPNVLAGQNGTKFQAVFSNVSGSATTTAATMTVNFAPSVTTNPTSQSVSAGSQATFTAAASGNPTPTVQWQISTNGGGTFSNIAGATSTTLAFTTAAGDNGNQYRAVFTNTVGTATTTAATLTVTAGPVITQNPVSMSVNAGQTATFTAGASGTPTPTVQWQFSTDGGSTFNNVAGATTTTLTIPNVLAGQNGTKFRAVFSNVSGSATTTAATMTVNFAPSVTTNPISQSVSAGSQATFVAAASGTPTPTVQWQISTNGGGTFANIAGATSTTLSFTSQASDNGNQYRAVFTNTVGSATTTAATLTVTGGIKITPTITWANPFAIQFGSALGTSQLNAIASVPGTFKYTPDLGTVLLQGNAQTLSVVFTPADTTTYSTAMSFVLIDVIAAPGPAQLVVTRMLTRDIHTNEVLLTFTFANTGTADYTNLSLTKALIGTNNPTSPVLPVAVTSVVPGGGIASIVLRYPANIGAPGSVAVLQMAGSYDQGSVSSGSRIILP